MNGITGVKNNSLIHGSPSPLSKDIKILSVATFTLAVITVLFGIAATIAMVAIAPFLCTSVLIVGLWVCSVATTALAIAFAVTDAKEKTSKRVVEESKVDQAKEIAQRRLSENAFAVIDYPKNRWDLVIIELKMWQIRMERMPKKGSEEILSVYKDDIELILNKLIRANSNATEAGEGDRWDSVLVSYENKKYQAIALYNSRNNRLAYLITNIDNLSLDTNKNLTHGSASLINHLIELSKEVRRDLTLSSTKTAIPFYEKLGFKRISDEPLEGPVPMIYKVS